MEKKRDSIIALTKMSDVRQRCLSSNSIFMGILNQYLLCARTAFETNQYILPRCMTEHAIYICIYSLDVGYSISTLICISFKVAAHSATHSVEEAGEERLETVEEAGEERLETVEEAGEGRVV